MHVMPKMFEYQILPLFTKKKTQLIRQRLIVFKNMYSVFLAPGDIVGNFATFEGDP